jgi:hypothetical protein
VENRSCKHVLIQVNPTVPLAERCDGQGDIAAPSSTDLIYLWRIP